MRPTDVDRIADAVISSLAGTGAGLLGCGSISSPIAFDVDFLDCGHFECGGAAPFSCTDRFGCGQPNGVAAPFYCGEPGFTCEAGYQAIIKPVCPSDIAIFGCGDLSVPFFR
jgi:hypothetical protein